MYVSVSAKILELINFYQTKVLQGAADMEHMKIRKIPSRKSKPCSAKTGEKSR